MKRIATLGSGLSFLVGVPILLVLFRLTVGSALRLIVDSTQLRDSAQIIFGLAVLVLWVAWLWGTTAVVIDVFRTWGNRRSLAITLISHRASLLFVVALWSVLFTQRATTASAEQVATHFIEEENSEVEVAPSSFNPIPLALAASALLIAAIIGRVEYLKLRQLRGASSWQRVQPLSRRSQFALGNLMTRESLQNVKPVQLAILQLQARECSPKVAIVEPNGETRTLLESPRTAGPVLAYVPLGLTGGSVVLIALHRGSCLDIVADNIALAESASRHVIAAAQLLAVDGSCSANIVRDTYSAIEPNAVTIRILPQSQSIERLELTEHGWMLFPTRTPLSVFGMSTEESTEIEELFEDVKQPLISVMECTPYVINEWSICVRLLGPVGVQTKEGNDIQFEKSKALELLAWISTHRERPTRVAARTALWEMNVQDATFNNIVSDLRRGLSRSAKDNSEILLRTFSDNLSLLDTVITDADILERAVHQAHQEMNDEAADSLRQALIYVRDLPFAGTRYLWPDTEGITSRLVLTAITAAILLAEHCLEHADIDGVFWATGQGLKVLRGHEELIALRMRAFAARGDFAGIESEWSSYERTVRRDRHFGGSISPILREVHQGLIA